MIDLRYQLARANNEEYLEDMLRKFDEDINEVPLNEIKDELDPDLLSAMNNFGDDY